MGWKRTKAKNALIEIFPVITSEDMIFMYKEVGDKIQVRYTFQQMSFDKKDIDKYLEPLNEDVSPELSHYLDNIIKNKNKNKI